MWMESKLREWIGKCPASQKAAFLSTFFVGLIGHLYIFTNIIPNFDGISRVYDEQQMTIAGRWFLHYASVLNWYTQMPMVIGVLSLLILAFSQAWAIRLFQVKSVLVAIVWGSMSVLFPAVADTLTYTFTFSAYCVSFLLATAAVSVTFHRKWGVIPGVILLAFSMGIYQTYVTVAISLSILLIIKRVLEEESKTKDCFLLGIRFVIMLSGGTILYYMILKVFLSVKELKIWSYLGMENIVANGYPISQFGDILGKTYSEVFGFFFKGEQGMNKTLFSASNGLIVVATLVLLATVIIQRAIHKNIVKMVGIFVLLLLLPLAVNFTQVMGPFSEPRLIMMYSFMYLYFLPLLLSENIIWDKLKKAFVCQGACTVFLITVALHTIYFWEYDNLLYTLLDQAHRATLSFVTNVVSRVESCEGYQKGMQVVVIGGFPSDRYDTQIPVYDVVKHQSALTSSVIPLNKHIYYYMHDWINVPIYEPDEQLFIEIANSQVFQEMPLYPDDGSVREIGGCVVVKMSNQFIGRSEYEKEYEKRR